MKNVIERVLEHEEYHRISLGIYGMELFRRVRDEEILDILLIEDVPNYIRSKDELFEIIEGVKRKGTYEDGVDDYLVIFITATASGYRELTDQFHFIWYIDPLSKHLIVYENQRSQFHGIEDILQEALYTRYSGRVETIAQQQRRKKICHVIKQSYLSISLVFINTLIYIVLRFGYGVNDFYRILDRYGLSWNQVFVGKEYERVITHMFLHESESHLFGNMLILLFVGSTLESVLSKSKYLCIYFSSGIIAAVVSMEYNKLYHNMAISVGASGAIFGLVGALAYIVVIHRGRLREISTKQIVMFVLLSLYGGFTSTNVDNAGHIGGLLCGILGAMCLYVKSNKRGKYYEY